MQENFHDFVEWLVLFIKQPYMPDLTKIVIGFIALMVVWIGWMILSPSMQSRRDRKRRGVVRGNIPVPRVPVSRVKSAKSEKPLSYLSRKKPK